MHAPEEFGGTVPMTAYDIDADVSWTDRIEKSEDLFE